MSQPQPTPVPGRDGRRLLACLLMAAGLLASCNREPAPPSGGPQSAGPPKNESARQDEKKDAAPRRVVYTDIAHAYHGLLLDHDFKEIKLDKAAVESIQDSMLASLSAVPDVGDTKTVEGMTLTEKELRPALDKPSVEKTLSGLQLSEDERLILKSALIEQGIEAARPAEKAQYKWRFDLIIERTRPFLNRNVFKARPEFERLVASAELTERFRSLFDTLLVDYAARCRAADVPIPPDWPNGAGWTNQGVLPFQFNFLQSGQDTEVWTYQAPDNRGLCYALPRKNGASLTFLGIICQSERTGKACFWDNIDAETGARIEGENVTLEIARLENGSNLAENCTECHRGGNVFLVHPNTPLGNPPDREPAVRYSPIGQAHWSNPPPLLERGSTSCSDCHEIADPTTNTLRFCRILRQAAEKSMPSSTRPVGWLSVPDTSAYFDDISLFRTRCP